MPAFLRKSLPLTLLALAACQTAAPLPPPPTIPAGSNPSPASTPVSNPQSPIPLPASPRLSRKAISGIDFEGVSFDSRSHRLAVVDQANGPGSIYQTSEDLAIRSGALLAINAGFFTPEGKPLGLVISKGRNSGAWNSASSLGSGIFMENSSGTSSIIRRASRAAVAGSRELIQAGPLLIENGKPVGGLDPGKSALRSIILTDGGTRWWVGKTSSCTLAALAQALANASPAPWEIRQALNLDGGRSTDLFISGKIPGGPVNRRGFLNRPVRNFIILIPR